MPPGSSISMYGMRICANGIWFGWQFLNVVRFWVSAGFSASVISRRYLFVIVRMDLNQWIQQIGTYMIIQEGVREEIPYNAQMMIRSSRFPTCAYQRHQHIQQ
ncbi:S-locus-specific glycoprotein S14-like [Fagus crenata]